MTPRFLPGRYSLSLHAELPPGPWLSAVHAPDGVTVVREAAGGAWLAMWTGDGNAHAPETPGMLVALLTPLAAAGIPVMVSSTHDADVVLVPFSARAEAVEALRAAGQPLKGV